MTRSKSALLLACLLSIAMSAAVARDIERLSAGDSAACPSDLAAAKAQADQKHDDGATRTAGQAPPVPAKPTVRGTDATSSGSRLHAPRWHSFLPGMFR